MIVTLKLLSVASIGQTLLQTTSAPPRRRIRADTTSSLHLHIPSVSPFDEVKDEKPNYHILENIQRVFCLSDVHTDHEENMEWLQTRMSDRRWSAQDLIVVAGDISHDINVLQDTMRVMKKPGCQVFFVFGNHEAWREISDREENSFGKIIRVYDVCRQLEVYVDPCFLPSRVHSLWIIPIQSWYDGSLSFAPKLEVGFDTWPWADFSRCSWPSTFPLDQRIPTGLTDHFLSQNKNAIGLAVKPPAGYESKATTLTVMTASHFLPNVQTLPDWKDLNAKNFDRAWLDHGAGETSAKFAKVAGSVKIDEQIRSILRPDRRQIHLFGHSHRPKDLEYAGIRYIHNPLGKPRERELLMVSPHVDFQLVWTRQEGEIPGEPILRYWEEQGGGKEALWERLAQVRPRRYNNRSN